ncbi:MAG: 3-deoxy-manno-octulosonate cytidylyltransferase [Bacteroidales bacterium]|nr:3-deoxy-manno-octulosonate cytidylyltransferase [Bacteroidales bacterium]
MSVLVVIPARYASTRFPGKPLAMLGGESIVGRVWHAASAIEGVDKVLVATDDERIYTHVNQLAGHEAAMMTSADHQSGTDRCGEVQNRLKANGEHYDIVINLQGDEPFVEESQIKALIASFEGSDNKVSIATLRTPITSTDELLSPNNVKVVCASDGKALYFSRQPIPYQRGVAQEDWTAGTTYYKHVGIYAFRANVLEEVCHLKPSTLERCEKLEQLRWLEAGYTIKVCDTVHANIGIDTPDDLAAAERHLAEMNKRTKY